jgi:hypothetical protein
VYSTVVMAATLIGALLASVLAARLGLMAAVNAGVAVVALAAIAGLRLPPPSATPATLSTR